MTAVCPACGAEFDQIAHPRPGCPQCLPVRPFFAVAMTDDVVERVLERVRTEIVLAHTIPPERPK